MPRVAGQLCDSSDVIDPPRVLIRAFFDLSVPRLPYTFLELPSTPRTDMRYQTGKCRKKTCGRTFLVVDFLPWRLKGYCCEAHMLECER